MFFLQASAQRLAARGSTFFILEDDDLKRVTKRDGPITERLGDFDGGKRAHVAVIVAAHGNRVDMRADQNWLQRRVAAGTPADDISRDINMHFKSRRLHQTDGILSALQIGFRVGNTADATLRVGAKLRELFQMIIDASAVHTYR